jgi:HEAT repeat protein/beta-lactamase regulating signal transducer with metallopeptidase domain
MSGFTWVPDAAWRGALLLVIALMVARLLRQQPAAVRHVLWTAALAGVMAMPVLAVLAPVRVPVAVPQRVLDISSSVTAPNALGASRQPSDNDAVEQDRDETSAPISNDLSGRESSTPVAAETTWYQRLTPAMWIALVWLAGVAVFSIRLFAGFIALSRMRRAGRDAADSVAELADACAARLGLHDAPRVIVSSRVAMPCTAGWIKPVILLPDESATWSPERLEIVLLHELSHIRRMDIVPHVLSEFARAIYWFNPLVWLAAARLRAEAERATDDRVVNAGAKPSDYAAHLLDIVRKSRPMWHPAPLMPLARRTEFEGRMLAILESGGKLASTRWAFGTLALVAGLSVGVASMEGASAKSNAVPGNDTGGVVPPNYQDEAATASAQEKKEEKETENTETRLRIQGAERESAIGALAEALRDPVASVRQAAAEALGSAKDSVAVRALMEVLRTDESPVVRRAAAWSLGEISDELAVPALSDALTRDRDAEVRKNAASALGSIDSPRGTAALTQALERDTDVSVRVQAAESLANIEDPSALDVLIRVLDRDDDPSVRRAVIEAIHHVEGARALPAVSRALRDDNAEVRRAAADALGSMDDNDAVPALMSAATDRDVEVRKAVIQALSSLGDRRALSAFVGALSDGDAEVRYAAAEGIGNLDNLRTAPPELIRAMEDKDAEVRHAVAHALGHIEDPAAIRALVSHISDANVEVRQAVVEALDQFDDPSVTTALRAALKDSNAEVRQQAAKALGNRNRSK